MAIIYIKLKIVIDLLVDKDDIGAVGCLLIDL